MTLGQLLSSAFKKWQPKAFFLAGIILLAGIVPEVANQLGNQTWADGQTLLATSFFVVYFGLQLIFNLGMMIIALKIIDGQTPKFTDLFTQTEHLWNFFLASLLLGIIITLGFIAFIIPGIYLAIRSMFTLYLVFDQKLSALDALKKSFELTKGNFWELFGANLIVIGLVFIGILIFFIGVIFTAGIAQLFYMELYRKYLPANKQQTREAPQPSN